MSALVKPDDITTVGTREEFAPIDISTHDGRHAAEMRLLKSQPNRLRDLVMDLPALAGKPLPEMKFDIHGWVPRRAVTLFVGIGGGGKTTIAMQMAAAISVGLPWFGLQTRQSRALCLLTEDDRDVCHTRAHYVALALGKSLSDMGDFKPLPLVQEDTALMRFDRYTGEAAVTHVYNDLRALCFEVGSRFIVLDALHGLFDGNENDRAQARRYLAKLTELAVEIDGAIVLLAHPSKASGQDQRMPSSGSTSWQGGVRSVIHVSDPDDANPDARTIRLAKANYGRVGEKIEVTWRDGVFHADEKPEGIFKGMAHNRADRVMLGGLRTAYKLGYEPSMSEKAPGGVWAPKLVAAQFGEGQKVPDLQKALNRLIQDGAVVLLTVGPPSRSKTLPVPKEMLDEVKSKYERTARAPRTSNTTENVRTSGGMSEGGENAP